MKPTVTYPDEPKKSEFWVAVVLIFSLHPVKMYVTEEQLVYHTASNNACFQY